MTENPTCPLDENGEEILFCPDCGKETAKVVHSETNQCSEIVSYVCSECNANFWRNY